jgi:diadenosine tetraphosphate (Ap4A) HIT family hydrolase
MITEVACQGADLCQELAGSTDTSFTRVYRGDPPSRRIVSTSRFEVLADMSPLVVGHLLLLPRQHHLSFARVIADDYTELRSLLAWLIPRYAATFASPLVLEHGSTEQMGRQACVTHAHWHIFPVSGDAVDELLESEELPYRDLDEVQELGREPWLSNSYYFRLYRNRARVYLPAETTPRQYLRSIVGKLLSIEDPEWDYSLITRKEHLRLTMHMTASWTALHAEA